MTASPSATPIERILPRVTVDPYRSCWVFGGAKHSAGYGVINIRGTVFYTHRLAYEWFHGDIPDGLTIDHLCRNRPCCNPMHLEAVTSAENIRRAMVKSHCLRGHEFTPQNSYIRPDNGRRQCIKCIRLRTRKRDVTPRQREGE